MQHQTLESYIEDKKNLYTSIHGFLEESDENSEKSFQELINIIRNQQFEKDEKEMSQFLEIIKSIEEHHHRAQQFNERMNQLLLHYKDQIKQTMSNIKIFHI